MKNFFLSLKTTVWTLVALIGFFFIGSYMMPAHREVFVSMNDDILFNWARRAAANDLAHTGWFFAAFIALLLLASNTLTCGIQAVKGKWTRSDFLLRLSPQVIHTGFLFILLAHLLGAGWGYKLSGMMPEGAYAPLPEDLGLQLGKISVQTDGAGYTRDWSADASLYKNNHLVKSGVLGPNNPLVYGSTGIYIKDLNFARGPAAYLLIAKDPGAIWALVGGLLFLLGSTTLLALKWKKAGI